MTRAGHQGSHKFRKKNQPPTDSNWIWLTREMLESPAWRASPVPARLVVERVICEHLGHGGRENGDLPITFDDFEEFGIRRPIVKASIQLAVSLGWIDIVEMGVKARGPA